MEEVSSDGSASRNLLGRLRAAIAAVSAALLLACAAAEPDSSEPEGARPVSRAVDTSFDFSEEGHAFHYSGATTGGSYDLAGPLLRETLEESIPMTPQVVTEEVPMPSAYG